jgi:glycosyltransferase involved in cell wall biosynthesis
VVTCSDFDARQIEKYYHVPAQQICTYYLAADDRFTPERDAARLAAVRAKYGLPQRFVLSMGVIHNRRNVEVIIQAFDRIKDEVADVGLVVIGRNLTQQPRRDIDGLMAPLIEARRAVRIPWIDDDDLVDLYRASSLFVITSTVDGETLLLKEAMKCGVPVLTSSLLEGTIGGNGYIIEDPESIESTADALRRALLDDEAAREDLVRRGIEWNRQFSWDEVARKSLQFLEATGRS